jgi:hypothetical protein
VAGVQRGFPQPLQANTGTAPQIISQPLPPKLLPVHCPRITLSFDVVKYAPLRASLTEESTLYNEFMTVCASDYLIIIRPDDNCLHEAVMKYLYFRWRYCSVRLGL